MNVRELVVRIEQILVQRAVADDGGRELLAAVHGIVQRERESAFADILLDFMNIIHGDQARDILPETVRQREVLVGEVLLLSAGGVLLRRGHNGLEPHDGIALRFVILAELLHVLQCLALIIVLRLPEVDDLGAGFLVELAVFGELQQIVGIRHIVYVSVLLPFAVFVDGLLIVAQISIGRICRKDQIAIEQRVHHHHDDAHHDNDGQQAA